MPVSLHTASVGSYLQILPSIAGLIDKAETHCRENSLGDEALTSATLAADMWPLAKQITSVAHHSAGAIKSIYAGVFGPDLEPAPLDFAALRARIADAIAMLQGVDAAEIDGMANNDTRFEFRDRRMDFTVADFLLTFSLPNFYFHATTTFGILRNQGLAIGKMDFMGRPRMKG